MKLTFKKKVDPYSVEGLKDLLVKKLLVDPLGSLILGATAYQLEHGKISKDQVELIVDCVNFANIKDDGHRSALIDKALNILELKIVYERDAEGKMFSRLSP